MFAAFQGIGIQVKVEVLSPGAAPDIFIGIFVSFAADFDYMGLLGVEVRLHGAGRTVLDALAAHVTERRSVIHRGRHQFGISDNRNKTAAAAEFGGDRQTRPADFTQAGRYSGVHMGKIGSEQAGNAFIFTITPDIRTDDCNRLMLQVV